MTPIDIHKNLLQKLQNVTHWPHAVTSMQVIETHISSILLTGEFAYKIKKPVDFGFVDFTTLSRRKFFCEEEIRLNSRLAPDIYLDTVAIRGSVENPQLDGDETIVEYAVKMRQFDSNALLGHQLNSGLIAADIITSLADKIADFHQQIALAAVDSRFGRPDSVLVPMDQNFEQIRQQINQPELLLQIERIEAWTHSQFNKLEVVLQQRKDQGYIRECHGDLHLGNIAYDKGELIIFDGIEFNEDFRWIDVISEMAFLSMDLIHHQAAPLATLLINRYLEKTGDYASLRLLRFYQVYRAMVRAKIACLSDAPELLARYIDLAAQFMIDRPANIILMYGLSASGKSTIANELAQQTGAIQIRSDRERKRLFAQQHETENALNSGRYSPQISELTYHHLLQLAQDIIESGYSVIVDATFLQRAQRQPFEDLARRLATSYSIIQLEAAPETLLQRLQQRRQQRDNISDATGDVIQYQLKHAQPPQQDEHRLVIDTEQDIDYEELKTSIEVNGRLG